MTSWMWLAHANPFTNSHAEIIQDLKERGIVYMLPVIFKKDGKEVNTKSLPFNYEIRKEMIKSLFNDSVNIFDTYTFEAPYTSYITKSSLYRYLIKPGSRLKPSKKGLKLRDAILSKVPEPRYAYTGDEGEFNYLKDLGFNPVKGDRKPVAATSVRELMYKEAITGEKTEWRNFVPPSVVEIINQNWEVVKYFAGIEERTHITRSGLKIPKDGF